MCIRDSSIYFQYTYGSGALLIYLALVNFRDIKNASGRKRKGRAGYDGRLPATVCALGLLCGLVLIGGVMYNKSKYAVLYHRHYEEAAQARTLLDQIPPDASVKSSTFFLQMCIRDRPCMAVICAHTPKNHTGTFSPHI